MVGLPTLVLKNADYDAQLQRTIAASYAGMADIGEAVAVARRVRKPAPDAWFSAWSQQADRLAAAAEAATAPTVRRSRYLRASEYYRQAFFFLRHDIDDSRLQHAYGQHVAMFEAAVPLLDCTVARLEVPFAGHTLHGYLFSPDDSGRPRPTVIAPCGYDSTAQEGYGEAAAALANGYASVTFDGPGQGAALYRDRLFFDPDFAPVLTAVVDQLVGRPEVDADALVLFGRSFAGYLAPQAATAEHRIAALVCDPAQPDMGTKLPSGVVGEVAAPVVTLRTKVSSGAAEFFGARMATHGVGTVAEYFAELRRFTMLADAGRITCPTLIIECEGDFVGGGGPALQQAMTAPAVLVNLSAEEGAGGHCAGLGQRVWQAVVYDWLASVLAGRTQPAPAS